MPTISMFLGIIIRMYFGPAEHNPPHIWECGVDLDPEFIFQKIEKTA